MNFLKECAERLKSDDADLVLKDMRKRYTTVRCLRVKTGLVRKLYMGNDSEEFTEALEKIKDEYKIKPEEFAWIEEITTLDPDKGPWYGIKSLKSPKFPEIATKLHGLPRRLPKNVWNLSVTKNELKECKKLATNVKLKANSKRLKVEGKELLDYCRTVVDTFESRTMYELALAVIFLTGRRTCEIMNGKSVFTMVTDRTVLFEGQAKKKNTCQYEIPILYEYSKIHDAFLHLRKMQGSIPEKNDQVTSKYSSGLRQYLLENSIFKQVLKIHNLRKTYACLCLKLFDWGEPSDLYICMHILGHNDLTEPIVYNVIDVGPTNNIQHMGKGTPIPSFDL